MFLNLPQELQDEVYTEILGNRTVHIKRMLTLRARAFDAIVNEGSSFENSVGIVDPYETTSSDTTLAHSLMISILARDRLRRGHTTRYTLGHETCRRKASAQDAMHTFRLRRWPERNMVPPNVCHPHCESVEGNDSMPQLNTALLFTCKRVHEAAIKILYTQNTFCFAEKWTSLSEWALTVFSIFCINLPPPLRGSLRNLYLRIPMRIPKIRTELTLDQIYLDKKGQDLVNGTPDFGFEGLQGLNGLQVLSLEFFPHRGNGRIRSSYVLAVEALAGIRALRLRELYVILWNGDISPGWMTRNEGLERELEARLLGLEDRGEEVDTEGRAVE